MKIVVASGKGGTGKTLVSASMAFAMEKAATVIDADVEEPDAHIFIGGEIMEVFESKVKIPAIDNEKCSLCGVCVNICRFSALAVIGNQLLHYPGLCHSCGACTLVCGQEAISEKEKRVGEISVSRNNGIRLVSGMLDIGEARPVPVIMDALDFADQNSLVIIDSAPGVSCAMTAAVSEADYCILVTENTPFGLHDLNAAIEVLMTLDKPFGVIVNKWRSSYIEIDDFLEKEDIPVLLRIPLSGKIAANYSKGLSLVDTDEKYIRIFQGIYSKIDCLLEGNR